MTEATDVAQNSPLWRLMFTFDAEQSKWCMPEMKKEDSTELIIGLGKTGYIFWNECFLWPNYLLSTNMTTKFACDAVLGR